MTTITAQQSNMWTEPVQVHRGEVWALGKHCLMCGDSTSVEDVAALFDGERYEHHCIRELATALLCNGD